MNDFALDIEKFLEKSLKLPVVDVRSPAEYERGHIPGAVNLPLFNNEERSVIGTLYLQKGSRQAMMKGLELIGPKMKEFADLALKIAPDGEALLHCWRGGMRSNSMAWLLNTVGIKTYTLEGGYKTYRRFAHQCFEQPLNMLIIGGMTGSGKTNVLEMLEIKGQQVLHLERLASHRGSVFGDLGMPHQPSTEQFENDLFARVWSLNPDKPVYIEDESIAIGKVFIPEPFFRQMSFARIINLVVPRSRRIEHLLENYTSGDQELLVSAVKRLEKRLGSENTARIIEFIHNGEMAQAVETVLLYYDKIYARSMGLHHRKETIEIALGNENADQIADIIINLAS